MEDSAALRRMFRIYAVIAVVIAVLVGCYVAERLSSPEPSSAASPAPGATNPAGVSAASTTLVAAVPAAGPACPAGPLAQYQVPCISGPVSASAAPREQVVNLWAYWCEPCRRELPLFNELAAKLEPGQVVGLHMDRNPAAGQALWQELGMQFPSFNDEQQQFQGNPRIPGVVPVTLFVRDGQILQVQPHVFSSLAELEAAWTAAFGHAPQAA